MRSKGVAVPFFDDGSSMEDVADGVTVDGSSMENNDEEGVLWLDTSFRAISTGDVEAKQPAPIDTYKHLPAPTNSNQQAAPTAEATNKQQAEAINNVIQPKPTVKEELPPPLTYKCITGLNAGLRTRNRT